MEMEKNLLTSTSGLSFGNEAASFQFNSPAELDATYFVIAWFAVTESASLGIFPILHAVQQSSQEDPTYLSRFFERGFQHFTDEQAHANMWCRVLWDFTENYPEVVRRVRLPQWYMNIMLKSIGKPHDVPGFAIDCLAFEVVMQALYDLLEPRLHYPPVRHILQTIMQDEATHTDFGRYHIREFIVPLGSLAKAQLAFRYWRNMLGVCITINPLLKRLHAASPLTPGEFYAKLEFYSRDSGIPGSRNFIPSLIGRLR